MKPVIWSLKELSNILNERIKNKFDGNLGVCGDRGNGKSTFISKLLYRNKKFDPWTHQVYSRPDVIKLLKTQKKGICFDDEAINSGYKRDFQNKGQQELIKILNAYRSNYNIHASAIPDFFNLDKDLRELYFMVIYILERGTAIIHMPIQGRMYSRDRWDAKHNAKVEESWSKKLMKDPNFKPPYHRLTTFRGYIYFNDLTEKQRQLYEKVRDFKRNRDFQTEEEKKASHELTFINRIYEQLINKKLSKDGLIQACLIEGEKFSAIRDKLNRMLTDNGINETVTSFLRQTDLKPIHNNHRDEINTLIDGI